ncbi:MAG: glycosyltransferase family 4 protein [Theionarchaea archaeon]|nr:glycosyltransferase family 4 protein [Theionarchaea archaeon]
MRVCHIGFSQFPGIGTIAMYEYSRNLARLGIDVHVIAVGKKREDREIDGVHVSLYESHSLKKRSIYPLLFTRMLLSHLRAFSDSEYDIIHVYHFPGSFFLPFFLKSKGRKWVFFTTSGPIRGGITSYMGWRLQSFESRFFDHIILRDESHVSQFRYRGNEISIVPIGVDLSLFYPGESEIREMYGIDPDEFLFLYVGNLHPARRVETLIEALKMVNMQKKAKLMVVGNGGTRRLKQYAEAAGSDHVIFTGRVPYDDVPSYMRCCSVFISYVPRTPEFDIQPPLKTVEALASGLPVIATDTLGNRRFITHMENGFLSGDDAVSLKNAMMELMENDALTEKLAKNAEKSVADLDWGAIVKKKLLPTYEQLLSG